jgi:hypothetical protein
MLSAIAADILGLLTCLFAFWKGGTAERIGAAIILLNIVTYIPNETLFHYPMWNLVIDAVTAIALLAVAVRYASFWQGAVMLLYAFQFSLHAFYFVTERPRDTFHVIANNAIFFAVCACLISGTALAWRKRIAERDASAT